MLVWPILWRDVPSLSPATWFIAHWWQQLELLPWFRAAWTWKGSWLRSGRLVRELGGGQAPSSHSCVWIFNLRSCLLPLLEVPSGKPQELPYVEMMGLASGIHGWFSRVSWVSQLIFIKLPCVVFLSSIFIYQFLCSERAFKEGCQLLVPLKLWVILASVVSWSIPS